MLHYRFNGFWLITSSYGTMSRKGGSHRGAGRGKGGAHGGKYKQKRVNKFDEDRFVTDMDQAIRGNVS